MLQMATAVFFAVYGSNMKLKNWNSFQNDDKTSNLQQIWGYKSEQTAAQSTYLYLYETKADADKELLARLVNFIRGLYMVSALPSIELLWDELLLCSLLPLAAQH